MLAPKERERLLEAMVGVYSEASPGVASKAGSGEKARAILIDAFAASLGAAEEELVRELRAALETIATAVSGEATGSATVAALGGAELTTRALLMAGEAERLPALLPGFAYLVSLPGLGEPQAARLAERVEALVEGSFEADSTEGR